MLQYPSPTAFMGVFFVHFYIVWFFPIYILYYVVFLLHRTKRDIYLRPLLHWCRVQLLFL